MGLPEASIYRTWTYERVFEVYKKHESRRAVRLRQKRAPADEQERTRRFQSILNDNPAMTRANLAHKLGCSRAWVTKVLGPS